MLRTVDVLEAILEAGDAGVSEVARATGQSPSAAYRVLVTLAGRGLVEYDSVQQRYRPGPRLLEYAFGQLRRLDVRRVARPYLEQLTAVTDETAVLVLRVGDQRMYVDQVESPREVRQTVALGGLVPLYSGASGKAILSALPEAELDAYLQRGPYAPITPRTIVDPAALRAEVESVRQRGFAVSAGERFSDTASVAAPFFGHEGKVVGALMLCGPVHRFSPQRLAEFGAQVQDLARKLSRSLGFTV